MKDFGIRPKAEQMGPYWLLVNKSTPTMCANALTAVREQGVAAALVPETKKFYRIGTRFGNEDHQREAQEALRGLVDRIVLTPSEENHRLDIILEGALSGLLALALRESAATMGQAIDTIGELVLVAGGRFHHNLRTEFEAEIRSSLAAFGDHIGLFRVAA